MFLSWLSYFKISLQQSDTFNKRACTYKKTTMDENLISEDMWHKNFKVYTLGTKLMLLNMANTINSFRVNFTKWSDTPKQFVDNLPMNCLSVFDYFVGLALKVLKIFLVRGRFIVLCDVKHKKISNVSTWAKNCLKMG